LRRVVPVGDRPLVVEPAWLVVRQLRVRPDAVPHQVEKELHPAPVHPVAHLAQHRPAAPPPLPLAHPPPPVPAAPAPAQHPPAAWASVGAAARSASASFSWS